MAGLRMPVLAQAGMGTRALALAVILAVVYLAIARMLDFNEKEPLWAMLLVFVTGAVGAMALYLTVSTVTLEVTIVTGPVAKEVAKFTALFVGLLAVEAVSRQRGFSEVNGVLDGIVYGAAGGFGFATGALFVNELAATGATRHLLRSVLGTGAFDVLWPVALLGLAHGVFGAVAGIALAAALTATGWGRRTVYALGGLAGAALLHVAYEMLRGFGIVGGSALLVRSWLVLLLPLAVLIGVVAWSLRHERRVIAGHLADEVSTGVVTADDLELLTHIAARRRSYAETFLSGDFDRWLTLKALHNRQVKLAFARAQEAREPLPEHAAEVARLRVAVMDVRGELNRIADGRKFVVEEGGDHGTH